MNYADEKLASATKPARLRDAASKLRTLAVLLGQAALTIEDGGRGFRKKELAGLKRELAKVTQDLGPWAC